MFIFQSRHIVAAGWLVLGITCFTGMPASADEIDEIVVVANKTGRPIRDVAGNVSVINRDELDANLATSLADLFRYTPGIDVESTGSRFGDEGISIRGIGGNRVAMLVDGVLLGDHFAVGSFSNATRDFLDAGLIQRIEVLHGPASAMYGSAAIGGVVAVHTPDPSDIAALNGSGGSLRSIWRASDDSLHGTALVALDQNGKGLLLGGSLRRGHEMDSAATPNTLDVLDFTRRSALAKLVIEDSRGGTWRVGLAQQKSTVASDLKALLGTGRFRSTTSLSGDDAYRMQLAKLSYEFGSPGALVEDGILRAYYQATDVRQKTLDERGLASRPVALDRFFRFEQAIRGLELNLHRAIPGNMLDHELGAGIEFRERISEEYRDGTQRGLSDGAVTNTILGETFPLRDFPRSQSREWGAYLEDAMSIGPWTLIAALRWDRYELAPLEDELFAANYPFAHAVSILDNDVSPKLGLIYHLRDATELYLQYSTGFRAPPYEHANIGLDIPAFNYRAIPNPYLNSERSEGFELGLRSRNGSSRWHAIVFRTAYRDFIEPRVRLGIDPDSGRVLFQAQNLASAVIEGLEAGWQWNLNNLQFDASIYAARGEDREKHQALESVGPAQATLGAEWWAPDDSRRLRMQLSYTAAWDDRDESSGPLFKPDAHTVLDFYLTQQLSERMTLQFAVLNVADTTWWHWGSVRGLSVDDKLIPHLAQPGRNVSLSLGFDW